MEVGEERDYIYLSVYTVTPRMEVGGRWRFILLSCQHQNDSCIKMGSDKSPSNVLIKCEGQSHKTVSTDHTTTVEEKGELKQIRTEVPLLTSLTPYR